MNNENNANSGDAKLEMAIRTQEQIFERFDSGANVTIKNVFEELKIPTPAEYIDKIALYKAKAIVKKEQELKTLSDKKQAAKTTAVEKENEVVEVKEYTEPSFEIDVDYESIGGSFDLVPLPSKGKMYKHKREALEVAFMTATDESIFMQHNLHKTKQIFNLLLKNKIIAKVDGKPIDVKELHHGDKNAILLFLRANAIGPEYKIAITRAGYDEPLYSSIDLTKVKVKELELDSDENGLFDYKYIDPKTGEDILIKFKFFNDYDEDVINARLEKDKEAGEETDWSDIYRSIQSVVSVNGIEDRKYVEGFVRNMNPLEYRKYKTYVIENEPGLDFTYILEKVRDSKGVESDGFPVQFTIGLDFFLYTD